MDKDQEVKSPSQSFLTLEGGFEGREHILPIRVYYEDTDFTGFVYHASYVRYFERGRSAFLHSLGIHHSALLQGPDPTAFVVTRLVIDYQKPGRIDDILMVRTRYQKFRGAKLNICQAIVRQDQVLAKANIDIACIDPSGRPKRPSSLLFEKLGPFFEPDFMSESPDQKIWPMAENPDKDNPGRDSQV